jgi:hypothetical protein
MQRGWMGLPIRSGPSSSSDYDWPYIIVVGIILCVFLAFTAFILFGPKAEYSKDRNLATLENLTIVDKDHHRSSKHTSYYLITANDSVKNFRFRLSKEAWDTYNVGDVITVVYDVDWHNAYRITRIR